MKTRKELGLIPIAYNPAQIRTRVDYEGPLMAFESLNLAAWLDPATAPPLMDPQIPAGIVCQIQGLFGEVGASLGYASDSGIPACVRPTETQDRKVVTVCCGRGLGAVVIIEAKQLPATDPLIQSPIDVLDTMKLRWAL